MFVMSLIWKVVIKTIFVCINPLKVGSTENYTQNLLTELDCLLMSVQSQIHNSLLLDFEVLPSRRIRHLM